MLRFPVGSLMPATKTSGIHAKILIQNCPAKMTKRPKRMTAQSHFPFSNWNNDGCTWSDAPAPSVILAHSCIPVAINLFF